ncbi:MAG TPA: hypothetical protein VI980_12120 [Acidimicrobiia bacterium]|nr:hypothetical protein [Acidimicrobiia bacterium]
MIYKQKQYLGNVNTHELHNTTNKNTNCQLNQISSEHRRWYDSIAEAKRDHPYDNCHWCLGGSTR